MTYLRSFLVVAFMWVVLIGKGQAAVTLSFADPLTAWTAGSLSQTYTDVDGSGVDIVISITGDTGNFAAGFPALDMNAVGIGPDDREALWFRIDSHATLAESIDISVDFLLTGTSDAASVTGVEATLLDIDYQEILAFGFPVSVFRDDIRNIEGDLVGGGTAPATATAISGTPSFAIVNDGASNMRLVGNGTPCNRPQPDSSRATRRSCSVKPSSKDFPTPTAMMDRLMIPPFKIPPFNIPPWAASPLRRLFRNRRPRFWRFSVWPCWWCAGPALRLAVNEGFDPALPVDGEEGGRRKYHLFPLRSSGPGLGSFLFV